MVNHLRKNWEGPRTADDVKRDSKSAITSNDTVTEGQRLLNNKVKRHESNLLIAIDHYLKRAATTVNPTMKHSMCEQLNTEPSMDAKMDTLTLIRTITFLIFQVSELKFLSNRLTWSTRKLSFYSFVSITRNNVCYQIRKHWKTI